MYSGSVPQSTTVIYEGTIAQDPCEQILFQSRASRVEAVAWAVRFCWTEGKTRLCQAAATCWIVTVWPRRSSWATRRLVARWRSRWAK